jgi:hypothetical protein
VNKVIVDLKTFIDFMLYCGFEEKFKPDIEKIFNNFAENRGSQERPSMRISIKSFQYNFKVRFKKIVPYSIEIPQRKIQNQIRYE